MNAVIIKLEGTDLLNLKLNASNVPFAQEAKKKMKEMGYDGYSKFTYKGVMFTSHDAQFIKDVSEDNLACVELEETLIADDAGELTKKAYNVVGYYNYNQLAKLEEQESARDMRAFKRNFFNVDTLVKNPELLSKLDLIEKLANASA